MRTRKYNLFTIALYTICGITLALPAIFKQCWFLGWIAYIPVLTNELVRQDDCDAPYKSAWKRGLAFFYGYGLALFYWLWELYPMEFTGMSPIAALFVILLGWLLIPLIQGSLSALNVVSLCFLKRRGLSRKIYPITAACVWVCLEWMQTLTWAGIPWGKLALGQTGMLCNVQSASLLGSYFVAFLIICFSGYLAIAIAGIKEKLPNGKNVSAIVCALVIFASNFSYGTIAMYEERQYNDTISVAVVQGNATTVEKWNNDTMGMLAAHKELTVAAGKDGADLIVLAETAIPYVINKDEFLTPYIQQMAKEAGSDVILGCLHVDNNGELYNSTRHISASGIISNNTYHKRRPVPFGEFLPFEDVVKTLLPVLSEINLLSMNISAGTSTSIFQTQSGNVGSLICFDSIYETLALQSVRDGAELLAISTNDSWFQDSAAVYQHNAHAILRAIETGRYVVRSANTGISSIITDRGEVVANLDPLIKGYLVDEAKLTDRTTPYVYCGNILITMAFLWNICIGLFALKYTVQKESTAMQNHITSTKSSKKKKRNKKKVKKDIAK